MLPDYQWWHDLCFWSLKQTTPLVVSHCSVICVAAHLINGTEMQCAPQHHTDDSVKAPGKVFLKNLVDASLFQKQLVSAWSGFICWLPIRKKNLKKLQPLRFFLVLSLHVSLYSSLKSKKGSIKRVKEHWKTKLN